MVKKLPNGGPGDFRLQIADCRFARQEMLVFFNLQSKIYNLQSPAPGPLKI
jgi:hypothetical protein